MMGETPEMMGVVEEEAMEGINAKCAAFIEWVADC